MPSAPAEPANTFKPATLSLRDLRPQPVSGHLLRARRASGDRWVAHWRDATGTQHKRVLAKVWSAGGRPPAGHLSRKGARERLDDILAEARRTVPRTAAGARGVTFAEAAAEWLRFVEFDRKRRPSTLRDYRNVVQRALVPVFGELALRELTSEMIDAYRVHLLAERRLSARSINKYLLVLHAIFRRAQRHWGLTANPVAGVERQPIPRTTEFRVLSAEQVHALARAAVDEQDAAIFTTAAFAGLRLGELRGLRWRDVDFNLRVIHVRRAFTQNAEDIPKSGRARAVPLTDQVARALDGLSRRERFTSEDDLVFPAPEGGHFEDSALRRRYYRALQAAGLKHLRFHDLRHTFGTLAVQEFSLSDVKAYMGHADISTTMIYVHHVPQHDAADRLSARLASSSAPARALDRAFQQAS